MVSSADRQALAAKNGKPRDANRIAGRTDAMDARDYGGRGTASDGSTIVREGDTIYRYVPKYDHTIIERNGQMSSPKKGNHLPGGNSIDSMIDDVLEMSGMTQPNNVPVPQARPGPDSGMTGMENHPGKMADDFVGDPNAQPNPEETAEPEGGWSMGDILLGVLGIGGATAAARALIKSYQSGKGGAAIQDGGANSAGISSNGEPDDITAVADSDEQRSIVDQKTKRIEGPRRALPDYSSNNPDGSSSIDESIASTLSSDEFDQRFLTDTKLLTDADMPYSKRNPEAPQKQITDADSPYTNRPGNFAPSNAPQVNDQIVQAARTAMDNGDIRGAFKLLNEAGIDIDPQLMEMFAAQSNTAKSLRQRALDMGAQGAADAVRRTAR